ncbi:hypothetical protein L1049_019022 [Liquidambar formosana]|uniref:Uncharacterized protein n=1 Tax=Liquidambar formosana TaxID=63359 RepID=A0AAP0WN71_LIQFO
MAALCRSIELRPDRLMILELKRPPDEDRQPLVLGHEGTRVGSLKQQAAKNIEEEIKRIEGVWK